MRLWFIVLIVVMVRLIIISIVILQSAHLSRLASPVRRAGHGERLGHGPGKKNEIKIHLNRRGIN